jgi:hypothetical protein
MADETTTGQGEQNQTAGAGATGTGEAVTLTKAELEVKLQKEGDRRVQQMQAKIKEEMQREHEAALEAERKRLEEERLREQGKWQEVAEKTDSELRALRAEKATMELRANTHAMLTEKGLSDLGKVFDSDLSNIKGRTEAAEALHSLIDARVEALVAERLRTDAPDKGAGANKKPGGDEAWKDFYAKPTP